jgi:hypothetical protein
VNRRTWAICRLLVHSRSGVGNPPYVLISEDLDISYFHTRLAVM